MIYYKKKSFRKFTNILRKIPKPEFKENKGFGFFSIVKFTLFLLCGIFSLVLACYLSFIFLLPKYIDEVKVENFINGYLQKNTKLSLDVEEFKVFPNYKLLLGLKAKSIKLNYSEKNNFITLENPDIELNLISLIFKKIDITKIKTDKITLNLNFKTNKKYNCFDYFDINSLDFNYNDFVFQNAKFQTESFILNLYDENVKKKYTLNAKNSEFHFGDRPIKLVSSGFISSNTSKISDFKINIEYKMPQNAIIKFKELITNLNYNPLVEAQAFNFYTKADVELKVIPEKEKFNIDGFISLSDMKFKLQGLEIPKNNIYCALKKDKITADFDFNFLNDEFVKVHLIARHSTNPFVELKIKSNDINLANFKDVQNVIYKIFNYNLDNIELKGSAKADIYLKSDFKTLISKGKFYVKDAFLKDKKSNLEIKNINSDVDFENNKINIIKSSAIVGNSEFYTTGTIDEKTNLDLKIKSQTLNMPAIMALIKNFPLISSKLPKFDEKMFKSTTLKIDAEVKGNLKKPLIKGNIVAIIEGIKAQIEASVINNNTFVLLINAKLPSKNNLFVIKNSSPDLKAVLEVNDTKVLIKDCSIKENSKNLLNIKGVINNFKNLDIALNIENKIAVSLPKFDNLSFEAMGLCNILGNIEKPDITGNLKLYNIIHKPFKLYIPEIILNIKNSSCYINIARGKIFNYDFDLVADSELIKDKIIVKYANFSSNYINLDTIQNYLVNNKLLDSFKYNILNLKGHITTLETQDIILNNFVFEGSSDNNFLKIDKFSADIFQGKIQGSATINIKTLKTNCEVILKEIYIRYLTKQLKDYSIAASGKLSALIKGEVQGLDFDSILRTFDGYIKFNINDGELSQFASLERFLQAGNILSQSILKLSLNSALSAITKQNTGDFKTIEGTVNLKDGLAQIQYIKTQGTNMSMYLEGNCNLLNNVARIVVLGRIPRNIVNVLGDVGSFSGGDLVEKMDGSKKNIIKSITASPVEKMMSMYITQSDIDKIPPLVNKLDTIETREFYVLINGNVQNTSSIKLFKWRSAE